MRIVFPIKKNDDENLSIYISYCNLSLSTFRIIVRNNMNVPQLKRIEDILKDKKILEFTNIEKFSITKVINQYLNSLMCSYDYKDNQCYFDVPKICKCIDTTNDLSFVIRLIEFGNNNIPPTNLIRSSYFKFCEFYKGIYKK